MDAEIRHCPFLNRNDSRCSALLSLEHLRHAFDCCLSDYASCSIYDELLAERRSRLLPALREPTDVTPVQVAIARRLQEPLAAAPRLPLVSGVGAGAGE